MAKEFAMESDELVLKLRNALQELIFDVEAAARSGFPKHLCGIAVGNARDLQALVSVANDYLFKAGYRWDGQGFVR